MTRKIKSYKGQKFNKLTILEDGGNRDKVLCRCECGQERRVTRMRVITGHIKSCGGLSCRDKAGPEIKYRKGQTFNQLTILENAKSRDKVLCRCSCGVEKRIRQNDVVVGGVKSCGCLNDLKKKSHKGEKFNKLTILEDGGAVDNVLCLCECGNTRRIRQASVTFGLTTSCGCAKGTHGKSRHSEYGIWRGIKRRCGLLVHYLDATYDPRWEEFIPFWEDMGPKLGPDYQIDKDLYGNGTKHYSKETCVWMTRSDNSRLAYAMKYGRQDIIDELREKYEPLRPIHN